MKKIFKQLLIMACALSLYGSIQAQDHIIGTDQPSQRKGIISGYNFGFLNKHTQTRNIMPWAYSMDSIAFDSSSVNSGDSITLLIGDVAANITSVTIEVDTGSASTAYVSGTTDSVLVYSVINNVSVPMFALADVAFTQTNADTETVPVSSKSDSDSCNFYLKIPATKWTTGSHSYKLYYIYRYKTN